MRIPKGSLGEETTRLVGSLVVARTWQATTARARIPQRATPRRLAGDRRVPQLPQPALPDRGHARRGPRLPGRDDPGPPAPRPAPPRAARGHLHQRPHQDLLQRRPRGRPRPGPPHRARGCPSTTWPTSTSTTPPPASSSTATKTAAVHPAHPAPPARRPRPGPRDPRRGAPRGRTRTPGRHRHPRPPTPAASRPRDRTAREPTQPSRARSTTRAATADPPHHARPTRARPASSTGTPCPPGGTQHDHQSHPAARPARPPARPAPPRAPPTAAEHQAVLAGRLTPRDRWIARMLWEHRVLTAHQITAMAFPSFRSGRQRLRELYLWGVVDRFQPFVTVGTAPMHYVLAPAGAAVLAAEDGLRRQGPRLPARPRLRHRPQPAPRPHRRGQRVVHRPGRPRPPPAPRRTGRADRVVVGDPLRPPLRRPVQARRLRPLAARDHARRSRQVEWFLEYDFGTEPWPSSPGNSPATPPSPQATGITTPLLVWLPTSRREAAARRLLARAWRELDDPRSVPVATAAADCSTPKPRTPARPTRSGYRSTQPPAARHDERCPGCSTPGRTSPPPVTATGETTGSARTRRSRIVAAAASTDAAHPPAHEPPRSAGRPGRR